MQRLIGICLCFISLSFFPYIKALASDYQLFFDKENTHLDSGIISLIKKWRDGQWLFESVNLNYVGNGELGNVEIENMYILRFSDNRLSILIIPRSEHRYRTLAWEMPYELSGPPLRRVEILRYHQDSREQDYIDLRYLVNNNDRVTLQIVNNYRDPEDRGYPRRQGATCSGPCQQTRSSSY